MGRRRRKYGKYLDRDDFEAKQLCDRLVRDLVWVFRFEERSGLHQIKPVVRGTSGFVTSTNGHQPSNPG